MIKYYEHVMLFPYGDASFRGQVWFLVSTHYSCLQEWFTKFLIITKLKSNSYGSYLLRLWVLFSLNYNPCLSQDFEQLISNAIAESHDTCIQHNAYYAYAKLVFKSLNCLKRVMNNNLIGWDIRIIINSTKVMIKSWLFCI